jgi:hypothetical protein
MAEKCCENLKSHTIFITEQKYGTERQFYVEEFVLLLLLLLLFIYHSRDPSEWI